MPARAPRRIDAAYLRRVLAWYLERHDAPAAHVRRLLLRRVDAAVRAHGQDREACVALVDEVVEEAVRNGSIDDARYAETVVRAARERGRSARHIQASLAQKGVSRSLVAEALDGPDDADRLAAIRYARRRRFGPWRRPDARPDARERELASMVRAGHPLPVARAVIDAADASALEDELPRGWAL